MQFVESLHERLRSMLEKRITLHILTSVALFIIPTGFNPEDLKLNFFEANAVCRVAVCSLVFVTFFVQHVQRTFKTI